MRRRAKRQGFSVRAVSGTYVVLLGMNINSGSRLLEGLLGFAIHRTEHTARTKSRGRWLQGYLTFEATRKNHKFGELVSTLKNPIQDFLWGDYTARAGRRYTYRVVPMYGQPGALRRGRSIQVTISTESEIKNAHAVFFNRGAAGSQSYARHFRNKRPDKVPDGRAFKWLSRGLEEGLIGFIEKAKNEHWALRAAVYEFQHQPVLEAFRRAHETGSNVRIIFDYKMGTNKPARKNWNAIKKAGITDLVIRRTQNKSSISHNKFIVLLRDGDPVEVWTGSTNMTVGGIFGHSNLGHVVRDKTIARKYYQYWQRLSVDPPAKEFREWNEKHTPLKRRNRSKMHVVFSPRLSLEGLEYYTRLIDEAQSGVFLTAAFGVNRLFRNILEKRKPYLRYLLLETAGANMQLIKRNLNNQIAVGGLIGDEEGIVDEWLKVEYRGERMSGLNDHVKYVHTKYMLIDPLSEKPIVITGSANFSKSSISKNDENMLLIRGDKRVADIYLGEFMRLFSHFRRRALAARVRTKSQKSRFLYLCVDDSWTAPFYASGSAKIKERLLFS